MAHTIPIYALYSLLFLDAGVSPAEVSALFAIWSTVGIVFEVPSGALADRFSRRGALVASGVLQAAGHAMWVVSPDFVGFAVGFALWGAGSSLSSGSFEALLYDGLAATGSEDRYARTIGLTESASLVAQVPASALATALYALGGFALVGWSSVGVCLGFAVLATRLPDHRPACAEDDELGYIETLRAGVREVLSTSLLRSATIAVALIFGLDAVEEYFPLQVREWGVRTGWVPLVVLAIPFAGAIGSAMTRSGSLMRARTLAIALAAGAGLLGLAAHVGRPIGVLGVVGFYGVYRMVLSVAEARLQRHITGPARATATSVASLAGEIVGIGAFGVWAIGGLPLISVAVLIVAIAMQRLLGEASGEVSPPR